MCACWTTAEAAVIITCPKCDTKYRYDEARFGGEATKAVKCTSCEHTFTIDNPNQLGDATNVGKDAAPDVSPHQDTAAREPTIEPDAPELPELAPLPSDVRYSMAVIAGPQAGSVFPITKPRVFIGRGSAMDVQLKDSEVSRRHAMLEVHDDEGVLLDLGATNGTYVEGARIDKVALTSRSEFTVGSTTLMFIVTPSRDVP
jgi:predicted Zn finger-like uncharacterized protein